MQKPKITPLIQPYSKEEQIVEQFLKNKRLFVYILIGMLLIGTLFGIIVHRYNKSEQQSSSTAYASLDESHDIQPHADLKRLKKIAAKHSFIQPHIDASLAQECLNESDIDGAKILCSRIKSRLTPHLNFLIQFNEVTLLIAENKYEEALKKSYALKAVMSPEETPVLYSYQMLRTAALEKKLNGDMACQHYFEELKANKLIDKQTDVLRLGQLSLKEFIANGMVK